MKMNEIIMQKTYQSTLQVERKPKDELEDAKNLLKKAEYRKALESIEDLSSFDAYVLKADLHSRLKDYKCAVECFDDALSLNDDDDDLMGLNGDGDGDDGIDLHDGSRLIVTEGE